MNKNSSRPVNRTIAELRRGRPVLLSDAAGAAFAVAVSAELAGPDVLEELTTIGSETPVFALTESRARALNIKPSGHPVILMEIASWLTPTALRTLADATSDLAEPFRGPFTRQKRPPSANELAAVQLMKHARLLPAAITAPVAADHVAEIIARHDLLQVEAEAVAEFEFNNANSLSRVADARVPLAEAENSRMIAFRPADGGIEHMAIIIGDPKPADAPLVRLHSECFTGDLLGSMKCDCGEQLRGAVQIIAQGGGGILLYLAQEGRGIGLINKLRAYRLQQDGFDTVDANLRLGFDADERVFRPAAEMLRQLGFDKIRLLTNNPDKVDGLRDCGIAIAERVEHAFPSNQHNEHYLATKKSRSGHLL
jgi:GTP cyclohydrolase II